MENLLTPIFEPIQGLYTCFGPIGRLDTSKWSMFVCFGKFFSGWKKFPKIGAPPSVLGVPLETLSPQTHLKSYDCLKCCCRSLECSLECKNGLLGTNFTDMGRNHHRQKIQFWNQWLKWHNLACCMCWFVEFGIPKLNFSTSQLSEAQEKAKIKTSQGLVFQILEVTLPKQMLKIFKRCQTMASNFPFRTITF